MIVKQPLLAVPLAFGSHFLLDVIPHYNPAGITRKNYVAHAKSWQRKMKSKSFRMIFGIDMLAFVASLLIVPFWLVGQASYWQILLCMIAAASPDFIGGLKYLASLLMDKKIGSSKFDNWHVRLQWSETPQGLYIELVYLVIILVLLSKLGQ